MNKRELQKYIAEAYNTDPDFPWESNPTFPAYYMSKDKWISVAMDGSVDDEQLLFLLDMSFELTDVKIKKIL